ncbi:MarR family winged helix-turn-helix transcriptional regulator [Tepidibacter aestuarii]|uniref:MarR family winged helix-turn-helix transcriptional regulator n=1 Tax=Tepidibacter aestuarii TaxID=2925782 RepID=UPI0020BF7702|nr:MarR family transcriptional regulator [Tepidibacter aestuarii]CAH2213546.1 HTH marR-type domain-containing protein [Tepidibacter aestuarii]
MKNEGEKNLDIRAKVVRQIFMIYKNLMSGAVKVMEEDNLSKTEIVILFMLKRRSYKAMDLAKEIGISPSTLTGVIDRLVERGYVERIRDEKDKRVVFIQLSELVIEKNRIYHNELTDLLKNSKINLTEKWWEDLSENLGVLENVLEEKSQELRLKKNEKK